MTEQIDKVRQGELRKLATGIGSAIADGINKVNEMRDKRIIEQAKQEVAREIFGMIYEVLDKHPNNKDLITRKEITTAISRYLGNKGSGE